MALVPGLLYGFYGFDLGTDGLILGRVVGAAIIGMGIINYLAREGEASSTAIKAILTGNLVYHFIDLFIVTPPTISGEVNAFTWSFVGLHLVLVIGFGYFLLRKNT